MGRDAEDTAVPGEATGTIEGRLLARWVDGVEQHIGCGDGWYPLLDRLDRQLEQLCPDYKIVRIRVKAGQLRYQIRLGTITRQEPDRGRRILRIRQTISQAEQDSAHISQTRPEAE